MSDFQTPIELIGMMDSPFVRRVAIALSCYELSYTLNPLSVYNKPEQLAAALALIESSDLIGQANMHHASIAIATSYRFASEVALALEVSLPDTPRLAAYCATLEAMPHFKKCR
jgi:glutathione S-transferase